MLRDFQQSLGQAVLKWPGDTVGEQVRSQGIDHQARVAIYRRNFIGSLTDTLRAAYPVSERIVGAEFFNEAAGKFAVAHPPAEPVLSRYGKGFADFLEGIPGIKSLPYLPDTARLEWARIEAYFAKDEKPLDARSLFDIEPSAADKLTFERHPSAQIIASDYPIHRIWSINQPDNETVPVVEFSVAETVLVMRPGNAVHMECISPAERCILEGLFNGQSLGSLAKTLPVDFQGELQSVLAAALSHGVFSSYRFADTATSAGG